MNTPAHVLINLTALRSDRGTEQAAVAAGALLPDAPMFIFYFVEKVVRGTPETAIWKEAYFHDSWQSFIDLFNSVPLLAAGWLLAWWTRSRTAALLFLSMLLHVACDFPFHHDDAHRHFYPLSSWRFRSPLSYWDVEHHGGIVFPLEALTALACAVFLLRTSTGRGRKLLVGGTAGAYVAYLVFAYRVWG